MNKGMMIVVAVVTLLIGLGGGYWLASRQPAPDAPGVVQPAERRVLFYRHPMNPEITTPAPAKDDMGMDYVPVYADEAQGEGVASIDPAVVQNMGMRTAPVARVDLRRDIRAVGRVQVSEERIARMHPRTEGWVEKLYVARTGEPVSKGAMLLSLYSPQLVASQQEYLLALNSRETFRESPFPDIRRGAEELVESARERLLLFGVPEHQLHELEQDRQIMKNLHLHSPFDGVVMEMGVREGQYVTPETELYLLADLSVIWVSVDVYEQDLPWIKVGDWAQLQVAALPGREFKGRVTYIYPYLEEKTRTAKVRLELTNPGLGLKPDMFANVTLRAGTRDNVLAVPREALIRTGTQDKVMLALGEGRFRPAVVKTGVESSDQVEIVAGLEEGQQVVLSGQFLIDAEASLQGATQRMESGPADSHEGH
ncbi:MAG: efflux transporter periplasmic adaptor subunit [Gammaproteobacteria bacterium RBG_16_57_12]|nr:MAG: efflux transporter periplasmic adaptor subunit [Gammaproteobacteria bacterium RBG_16_57_12]